MSLIHRLKGLHLKTRLLHPVDEFWERRFGVNTLGFLPEVGDYEAPDFRAAYVPTHYRRIIAGLRHVGLNADDVVVDLGCGLGRAVYAASWLGARRSVGVEIDGPLVEQARRSHGTSRLKERDIEFVCAPAQAYPLDDVTLVFMFNPFGAGIMQGVVQQLEAGLEKKPRRLRIVYENPLQAEVLDACPRLRRSGDWPPGQHGSPHPMSFWETA
ncbi:MAG TPA: methyltransferase domain-containing protein [Rhizobacter sp.]|nr:methyltransferase domain-containing protein [Rhizobacter sp.]